MNAIAMRDLTGEQRTASVHHHIDPGFINYRKCFSVFGRSFVDLFMRNKRDDSDFLARLYNNHLCVDLALRVCRAGQIQTLGEILQAPEVGALFCSTELLEGNEGVYEKARVRNRILLAYEYERTVFLEFGTEHFVSDTGKSDCAEQSKVSIIGQVRRISDKEIVIHPLIMGAPSLDHSLNEDVPLDFDELVWYGFDWYEIFPEDIDEFAECGAVTADTNEWTSCMESLPEETVKAHLCEILGDVSRKDWAGERADHFSTAIHLGGRRVTAAFLLKGPARFREMTPDLLGKRADQIYRLAQTPAQLLIVQHCHTIGEAVRATLRAFAVAPHNPRWYCLIDGKDTYRILRAYGKL
jgi:hypothetical protein